MNTFVVGYGAVGQELVTQIRRQGWNVKFIAKSDGVFTYHPDHDIKLRPIRFSPTSDLTDVGMAFFALPASENGFASREHAILFHPRNIKVVSCEKSLFAYHPYYLESFGCSAAVGGGCRLLPFLQGHVRGRRYVSVDIILNATLNYLMTYPAGVEEGAISAQENNLAESGSKGWHEVITREIADTVLKTCIVTNHCFMPLTRPGVGTSAAITPDEMKLKPMTTEDFETLQYEQENYRYIVSFTHFPTDVSDAIGGFQFTTWNGWHVCGGFRDIKKQTCFDDLRPTVGAYNSAIVHPYVGTDRYFISGPGAGPEPTARSMIQDAKELLRIR